MTSNHMFLQQSQYLPHVFQLKPSLINAEDVLQLYYLFLINMTFQVSGIYIEYKNIKSLTNTIEDQINVLTVPKPEIIDFAQVLYIF